MRERDGVVILWQAEAFLSWVAAAPGGDGGLSRLGYLASMWESARELVPAGGHVVRHRAFGAWDEVDEVAERLHEMGVELVHIPRCSVEQANYHLALEALGLVSMQVVPERLILVGCDASALPLARAVHRAGVPVAAVVCNLLESDFANWSFAVEPVVCVEHPAAEEVEDDAEVDADALVCDDDVEDSATEEETLAEPSAVIAVAPRKPWMKTIVTERVPVHVEVLPATAPRIADLSNPATVLKLRGLLPGAKWRETSPSGNDEVAAQTVLGWMNRMSPDAFPACGPGWVQRELGLLEEFAQRVDILRLLRRSAHHAVLAWLVQRFRHIQAASVDEAAVLGTRLTALMGLLVRHSGEYKPGGVNGMSRGHVPVKTSWWEDGKSWEARARAELDHRKGDAATATPAQGNWNRDNAYRELFELVRAETPEDGSRILAKVRELLAHEVPPNDKRLVHAMFDLDHLLGGAEFARLLSAVREERREREQEALEDEAGETRSIPPDWVGFAFTRGKRVAIIGGDGRSERRDRLREEFGFAEVEWVETSPSAGVARVHDLAQRMKNGSVEMVIVLQSWVSHVVADLVYGAETPECRVVLSKTYGVTQVRAAVERFFLGIRRE